MTQKKFVGWSVRPIRRTTIWKNMIHIVRSQFVDAVTPSDHIIAPPQRLQKRRFVCSRPQCGHRVSLVSGEIEDGFFYSCLLTWSRCVYLLLSGYSVHQGYPCTLGSLTSS